MKRALSYIIPVIAGFFACIPFIDFKLGPPLEWWPLVITCFGAAGMFLLTMRISIVIQLVALLGFISCFFSSIPYLSFNAYASIVFCCYFYIGVTKMESWAPTFKMLQAILLLNLLLMVAQALSHDQLLNFGLTEITSFGVVGQHMQEASFIVVLSALLIQLHPAFLFVPIVVAVFCNSSWSLLCVAVGAWVCFPSKKCRTLAVILALGFILMAWTTGKFTSNLAKENRLHAWQRTIELANEKPWTGWGPGTYKMIFPIKSEFKGVPWKTAHNCWLQFLFEIGRPMFLLLVAGAIAVFWRLMIRYNRVDCSRVLAGYSMIVVDMMVHFPTRMIQSVLLMLIFLAYCELTFQRRTIKMT